jgi:hypothetical protein
VNRRFPVVVILLGALLGALVFDGARNHDDVALEAAAEPVDASTFPIAASPSALSSTWFCAGGTGDDEAFADHVVDIANPTDAAVSVTLTAFGGVVAPPATTVDPEDLDEDAAQDDATAQDATEQAGATEEPEAAADGQQAALREPEVQQRLEVAPRGSQSIRLGDLLAAPVVSALVEAPSGGIVVEHRVSSVHGFDVKPCATSAASTWHFAWGDTTVDARELLVLFNPFPADAIVDGRFSTEDGVREPERFDGLVVPARSTLAVDLGDDVTRREELAATITARTGSIVADRIVRIDSETERGLTVQLGVPEPQRTWIYPDGFTSETIREEYVVYNPTEEVAEVEIELVVDAPEDNGIPDPIDLSLPPGAHQVVDLGADGRVPPGVAHSGIVRSANGVPIVAERVLFGDGDARRGITVTTGSPVEAEQWNFAVGSVTETDDEWLILLNLDPQILADVDVHAVVGGQLLPVADLQAIELGGGQRLAIRLGEHIANRPELAIVVTSSEPIVVERALYAVGADERGMSSAVGVPSPAGIRMPLDPLDAHVDVDLGDDPAEPDPGAAGDDVPEAPQDVELPAPDETIVIDDPDAEAGAPATTAPSTTAPSEQVSATTPG